MKLIWAAMLMLSSSFLIFILIKRKVSWNWFWRFSLHLVAAAGALYFINESGIAPQAYIPINPVTVSTIVVLGVPGAALLAGLQWIVV